MFSTQRSTYCIEQIGLTKRCVESVSKFRPSFCTQVILSVAIHITAAKRSLSWRSTVWKDSRKNTMFGKIYIIIMPCNAHMWVKTPTFGKDTHFRHFLRPFQDTAIYFCGMSNPTWAVAENHPWTRHPVLAMIPKDFRPVKGLVPNCKDELLARLPCVCVLSCFFFFFFRFYLFDIYIYI